MPRPDPKAERQANPTKLSPVSGLSPIKKEAAAPVPRPAKVTASSEPGAPLLHFNGLLVGECRPIHLKIAHGDRLLVLGSNQVIKQRLVDLLLAEEVAEHHLEDTAGYVHRAHDITSRVSLVRPAPAGATLRQHTGSLIGRNPSNSEMRGVLDLLGLGQWFADAERLYPGVSLDCAFEVLPATFPAEQTLLKVWAPLLLHHSKGDFKDQKFHVFLPDAFVAMSEQLIATTLGKLRPGTGWVRIAASEEGEVLEDGIVHSARCGRGSRRLDEAVINFFRDRMIGHKALRNEDLRV